jgi:hypothetical protein
MKQLETYLWHPAYVSAILETDDTLMPTRIYEALAAIEQRLLIPIEAGDVEQKEIDQAQTGLLTLKAERCSENATATSTSAAIQSRSKRSSRGIAG